MPYAAHYEQTLSRLENAENQIDDLKQQLDDALGAEEMVVQLTERMLEMSEVGSIHDSRKISLSRSSPDRK
jgi:hypothetical protein